MSETDRGTITSREAGGARRWFLLTGRRTAVTVVLLAVVAVPFVAAGLLDLATVTTPSRVLWFLNGTVNGLLTLVPISVGVNQIVLSHEFGSIEDLYERRRAVVEFRERVERRTETEVSSPRAAEFFRTLLDAVAETGRAFRNEWESDGEVPDEVEAYVRSVVAEAERTSDELTEDGDTMLKTLLTVLAYDDSVQFYETRRVRDEFGAELRDETSAKLYRVEELFTEIDAGRQYLKTVVVERQLARLSRLLIYTGIPSIAVAAVGIFTYRDVAWLTLSKPVLVGVAAAIVVTSLVPLAVLAAYILRVATIARRTAAFGPFVEASKFESDGNARR
ncbi:hypothetical protein M0R89_18505 (plasmid) [Halorussus limi]|uniref:Uncharacterized protein n=1 Tax=Halorussus limi TaxID=2938695 RepID=A0A8U0HZI1_9EURY|nr:hypothetical protein [Halorussus limi]UPV76525.1 hypothetical protein M0R89_18505 [Halorussus limi]